MSFPSDGGDSLEVTPQRLRDTAPLFHKASHDTADLTYSLNKSVQQLIIDMSSELQKSPVSLQHLCDRWHDSMNTLASALDKISSNLDAASTDYHGADKHVANTFQSHTYKGFDG
jgi:uncharacterized protein YukE